MTTEQHYTPDEEMASRHYFTGRLVQHNRVPHRLSLPEPSAAEFDRFIESVKRDAAWEALDGLIADTAIDVRLGTEGNDPQRVQDAEAVMDAAQVYRDTEYPEETP